MGKVYQDCPFKGSPPLTRELPYTYPGSSDCQGITPAYAGTTIHGSGSQFRTWDHPRLRGNYIPMCSAMTFSRGSPPLTRELLPPVHTLPYNVGITPAYAGTTNYCGRSTRSNQDHPRLRGNYLKTEKLLFSGLGSPPLTRELPSKSRQTASQDGITPAYAGTTFSVHGRRRTHGDHPRLRGNYLRRDHGRRSSRGSPPLTRELHTLPELSLCGSGITPAYAGTTQGKPGRNHRSWDHPRLRGNYAFAPVACA